MSDLFLLFISTVLVNNFVLSKFLGVCPFMGVSGRVETATGMAMATTFVVTLTSFISYLINRYVLMPLDLEYLQLLAFILAIAAVVQFTEILVKKINPLLHRLLGIFLPLIATNCAVLGVALLSVEQNLNLIQSMVFGLSAAAGFSLVLILFAGMRERIAVSDVPKPFRGASIALITAGLMSLAFMGFAGLVKA